ncbi:hypothetical protein JXQ70_05500 [bacterium]|nr:hypothetical protein [bacterium]
MLGSRWQCIGFILAWVCLFGPVQLTAQQSPSQDFWHVPRNGFWSFQLENDLFAINEKNGDKHYTNGFEFNYLFEHKSLPGHDTLLEILFNRFRFSISNVLRTKEFNNQHKLTHYGAVNLSISG